MGPFVSVHRAVLPHPNPMPVGGQPLINSAMIAAIAFRLPQPVIQPLESGFTAVDHSKACARAGGYPPSGGRRVLQPPSSQFRLPPARQAFWGFTYPTPMRASLRIRRLPAPARRYSQSLASVVPVVRAKAGAGQPTVGWRSRQSAPPDGWGRGLSVKARRVLHCRHETPRPLWDAPPASP